MPLSRRSCRTLGPKSDAQRPKHACPRVYPFWALPGACTWLPWVVTIEELMSAYRRSATTWVAIVAFGLLWIVLAMYVSEWYLVGVFATLALGRSLLELITCPNCGESITYEKGGVRSPRHLLAPFKRICASCGWDLRK